MYPILFKYTKRLLIALSCLMVAYVIIVQVENWRGQREWQRVQDELTAKGINLNWDDFIPASIADEQNLAMAPVIAHWRVIESETEDEPSVAWQNNWGDKDELIALVQKLSTDRSDQLDRDEWELLEQHIAPYTQLLNDIRSACQTRPRSRLPGDYNGDPFAGPMPPFSVIRNYSELLFAQARLAIHQGNSELALTNAATILRLSQLNEQPYYLVSAMIRTMLYRSFILPIYTEGLRADAFSDAQLQSIATTCRNTDLLGDLERAFRSEIAAGARYAEFILNEENLSEVFLLAENDIIDSAQSFMPEGWILIMFSRVLHYNSMLLDPFDVSNRHFDIAQFQANKETFDQITTDFFSFNLLAAMALPAFDPIQEITMSQHQLTDMCGIAAGLELYRRTHSELPSDLSQLAPDTLPTVYNDPLTSTPYHYQPITETTYRLWANGIDMVNNDASDEGDKPLDVVSPLSTKQTVAIHAPSPWTCEGATISESPLAIPDTETISVDFPDEQLRIILHNVADLYDINLVIPASLSEDHRVSTKLRDMSWADLFDTLLGPAGYTWYRNRNVVTVISLEDAENTFTDEIAYLEHLNAKQLHPLLEKLQSEGLLQRIGSCENPQHVHFNAHIAYATEIKFLIESMDATGYAPQKPETEEIVLELPGAPLSSGETFSVDYPDNSTYEIIEAISQLCELNVEIPNGLKNSRTSVHLRNITWQQMFDVMLTQAGYGYYEDGSVIRILRNDALEALPPITINHRCIFIQPSEFIDFHSKDLRDQYNESFHIEGKSLMIQTHPKQRTQWEERLEQADRVRGLPRYPSDIYWPDELPAEAFIPDPKELSWESDLTKTTTRVIHLDWMDARKIEPRLVPHLARPHDAIQVDRHSNALVITAKTGTILKISAICRFLDQKKWYLTQTEREQSDQ